MDNSPALFLTDEIDGPSCLGRGIFIFRQEMLQECIDLFFRNIFPGIGTLQKRQTDVGGKGTCIGSGDTNLCRSAASILADREDLIGETVKKTVKSRKGCLADLWPAFGKYDLADGRILHGRDLIQRAADCLSRCIPADEEQDHADCGKQKYSYDHGKQDPHGVQPFRSCMFR